MEYRMDVNISLASSYDTNIIDDLCESIKMVANEMNEDDKLKANIDFSIVKNIVELQLKVPPLSDEEILEIRNLIYKSPII